MEYDVYGVGNALVDIQVRVTDDMVAETRFDKGIMTLVDDQQQQGILQVVERLPWNRCAGGSAANTIVGIANLGGNAAYCGKVGKDPFGEFFLSDMRQLGIAIDVSPADRGPTGTCVVLITPDAKRTMLTNLGASVTLAPEDVDEELLRQSRFVYIEGYLLTGDSTKAAAYHAMELARKYQGKIALTASDPFLVDMIRDELWQLIEGPVDLFFCNEEEAKSLTGIEDIIDCAHAIHQHAEHVALTLGAKGAILMHGGEAIPIEGVEVDAIDTTGAGDMYAGALLYGITNGMTSKQAGHLAAHAAARVVAQLGARLEQKITGEEISRLKAE